MFSEPSPTIIHKRHSFLSVLAICGTLIVLAIIATIAGIGVYAVHVVDSKTTDLTGLACETLRALPECSKILPPVLVDAFNDVRAPDYMDQVEISIQPAPGRGDHRGNAALVEVHNAGDAVVSLLAMRILVQDAQGDVIREASSYAATPLQGDCEWRGPILPDQTRRFVVYFRSTAPAASFTHEITELRVWKGDASHQSEADDARAL